MTSHGVNAIALERQIDEEGWTPEHDAEHQHAELLGAAVAYIAHGSSGHALWAGQGGRVIEGTGGYLLPEDVWPWDDDWWKPSKDPVRDLVKAGALIAAEIDRIISRPVP